MRPKTLVLNIRIKPQKFKTKPFHFFLCCTRGTLRPNGRNPPFGSAWSAESAACFYFKFKTKHLLTHYFNLQTAITHSQTPYHTKIRALTHISSNPINFVSILIIIAFSIKVYHFHLHTLTRILGFMHKLVDS